jgi:hypothetical protein
MKQYCSIVAEMQQSTTNVVGGGGANTPINNNNGSATLGGFGTSSNASTPVIHHAPDPTLTPTAIHQSLQSAVTPHGYTTTDMNSLFASTMSSFTPSQQQALLASMAGMTATGQSALNTGHPTVGVKSELNPHSMDLLQSPVLGKYE